MSTEDKGFPGAVYPSQKIAELSADNARLRGELAEAEAAIRVLFDNISTNECQQFMMGGHAPAIARAQERRG